jgi:hypothetical protein
MTEEFLAKEQKQIPMKVFCSRIHVTSAKGDGMAAPDNHVVVILLSRCKLRHF